MARSVFDQHLANLGWSLWTELGVAGVIRNHTQSVLDLEPLLLATPLLAGRDARLRIEARRWSAAHGRWISGSRLKALARASSDSRATSAFAEFVTSTAGRGDSPPTLRMERPALLQLRLRALDGVGARADVLGQLLANQGRPVTARDLAWLGYAKRTIAGILADLEAGQIAIRHGQSNRFAYTLARPNHLAAMVSSEGLTWVDWRGTFDFLSEVDALLNLESKGAAIRRVGAAKRLEGFESMANRLGLERPPSLRGHPAAWERLVDWAVSCATPT